MPLAASDEASMPPGPGPRAGCAGPSRSAQSLALARRRRRNACRQRVLIQVRARGRSVPVRRRPGPGDALHVDPEQDSHAVAAHSATCVGGTPPFSHVDTAACRRTPRGVAVNGPGMRPVERVRPLDLTGEEGHAMRGADGSGWTLRGRRRTPWSGSRMRPGPAAWRRGSHPRPAARG